MNDGWIDNVLSGRLARIRRVNYVGPDGSRNVEEGPVELTFEGGGVLLLSSGRDGESLDLRPGPWVDPFAEPLSDENREFVRTSGKWTAFDVSGDPGYSSLVGRKVDDLGLQVWSGKLVGIRVFAGPAVLTAEVRADELFVQVRS